MSEATTIDGVNYGPLAALVGNWAGDKGVDKAPEPGDDEEKNLYYETITYEAIGDVTNAKKQTLSVLRYHQVVSRKSNDEVFHNETGYLMWDPDTDTVMQSLSIPRGVVLLAGGKVTEYDAANVVIDVTATAGALDFGILQQPFMEQNAKTTAFTHHITVEGDKLVYSESTMLSIYDKEYDHTDRNRLTRV
ncbi:hypothetical protein SIN8267_01030 [Sinobacterium norvegicum]|uniref:THAP4-like heme-binding domain-containing protein n=1 Tax=Sinobacterium norvegicum TaxID=1641715 RepID=A0ABM9ACL2_9GAMM|nr:heme-binding beta-barrel domain-containing protein [Sinobacterium norvegicum]CAH0990929.1 hypothetical protein SIN8267_01030 [Sinobacterium norvegicum]